MNLNFDVESLNLEDNDLIIFKDNKFSKISKKDLLRECTAENKALKKLVADLILRVETCERNMTQVQRDFSVLEKKFVKVMGVFK